MFLHPKLRFRDNLETIDFENLTKYTLTWLISTRTRVNNRQRVDLHSKISEKRRIKFFRKKLRAFREK